MWLGKRGLSLRRITKSDDRQLDLLASHRLGNMDTTLKELVNKAVQNEQILRRYQQFELKLLDVSGFENLLSVLLNEAVDYFNLDCTELWLYDPQNTLEELIPDEVEGLELLRSGTKLERLYQGKPEVRLISSNSRPLPVFADRQVRSAAILPLIRQGVLVGSLHLGAKGHQRFSQDKSTDFIAHLASIISVCFENAINQERLHRLSMYDMLTKVKNRRAFHQALESEVSRASRSGDPLSLLFVDLDHFKSINDRFGHQTGDQVLQEVAQFIHSMLRKTDHVCRYGGEEFALVLPVCGQQRAMEVAERIRVGASQLNITDDNGVSVDITLSIGVSCWLPMDEIEDDESPELDIAHQLVAMSDQGVYEAKSSGRNCIRYRPMVAEVME